jgi:hypothetical protein
LLGTAVLSWAGVSARAAAPICPGPATVDISVDDLTGAPAVDVTVTGTVVDETATCAGDGATTYTATLHCVAGVEPCGQVTGLRPGAWVNRVRAQVPSSDAQVQAHRAVFLADGAGVANRVRWTVYPHTVVVTQPTAAALRARLADAAGGSLPALVTFDPDAFPPGLGDAHPIVLTSGHCTATDVAGLCLPTSHLVVDGLDATGASGAVVLATNDRARLVRIYGDDVVLRGLVLRGSRASGTTSQADTVAVQPGAHGARVEDCVVHGPSQGDAIGVGGDLGDVAADAVITGTEVTDAADKGVKVTAGSHATVTRSCVHDNDNGGIQATRGGHVVTRENLVQHNVPPGSENGLVVIGENRERTTFESRGDVVRFSGGRGVSVSDSATATFVDDYVADNAVAGAKVESTVDGVAPTVTFRGTALVCNKVRGVAGICPDDAHTPCVIDADCCAGNPFCPMRCAFRTPEGFGLALASCADPTCLAPVVDLGTLRDPGANALSQNQNTADGVNLNQRLTGPAVSAIGDQWEHCGTTPGCDASAIRVFDVRLGPGASVAVTPGDVARADVPAPYRVSPARPHKGDVVRVYGGHFNAVDGVACSSATAPVAPCSADDPVVAQQNRTAAFGNAVTLVLPGTVPIAVDVAGVTPTMLVFTMPLDCYAAGTLRVAKRTSTGTVEGQQIPVCDVTGCEGQPDGTPCDDGDACTDSDRCASGECVGGPPHDCGGRCLGCDPALGCVPLQAGAPCDDGNLCTLDDHCRGDADVCLPGPGTGCDGPCLTGACGPDGVCLPKPAGTTCSDGDACTVDACDNAGTCVGEPMHGFSSVTCAFVDDPVRTPDCAHDRVPLGVTRRYARARRLSERAATAKTTAGAKRRLERAAHTLASAVDVVAGAVTRGRLSGVCGTSLTGLFADAQSRAQTLAATL